MDNMPMTKMKVGMTGEIFVSDFEVLNENGQEEDSNDNSH